MKEKEQRMVEWKKILKKHTEKLDWVILKKVGAGWKKWKLGGKKYSLEKIVTREGTYFRKLPSSSTDCICLPGLVGKMTALTFDTEQKLLYFVNNEKKFYFYVSHCQI